MVKTGLKSRDVSPGHFSSGVKSEPTFSRFVVRILEGKSLLASDVESGKSDPVCFLWLGAKDEKTPEWEKINQENAEEYRVVLTEVCPTTCNPIWNQDITFPLEVNEISHLENLKCIIYVRDEDVNADGSTSYDDLGMIEFNLDEFMKGGTALQNSIVKSAAWYQLKKTPGMRKIDGSLKLTVSIIFAQTDIPSIIEQIAPEKKNMNVSCGHLVQSKVKGKIPEGSIISKSSVLDSSIRPSSAGKSSSRKKTNSRPSTAPMLKTSSIMSATNSVLEESDEIPKSPQVKNYDGDDLVSEPSYDNIITQFKQSGPKFEEQPTIPEEDNETNTVLNSSEQNLDSFEHQLPQGDQDVMQELVRLGVHHVTDLLANSDSVQEAVGKVAGGLANVSKKIAQKSKVKVMGAASTTAPNLRDLKGAFADGFDRIQDKLGDLGGAMGGKRELKNSNSAANLFANGPLAGDRLENTEDLEELHIIPDRKPEAEVKSILPAPVPTPQQVLDKNQEIESLIRKEIDRLETILANSDELDPQKVDEIARLIDEKVFQLEQRMKEKLAPRGRLEEGMNVEVNYGGKGRFFPALIKKDRGDGTYDIAYSDGAQESAVKEEFIKLLPKSVEVETNPKPVEVATNPKPVELLEMELPKGDQNENILHDDLPALQRKSSSKQFLKQLESCDPANTDISNFQGNPTAVVRILRELHDQRQFMQNGLVLLAKASQKGYKNLSGRLNQLEKSLDQLTVRARNNDTPLLPSFGDQALPDDEDPLTVGIDEDEEDAANERKLSKSMPSKDKTNRRKERLNQTVPANRKVNENKVKSKSSGFRDFVKKARQKKPEHQPYAPQYEPEIEFVYKNEKGAVSSAKVVQSPVEFARQSSNPSPPPPMEPNPPAPSNDPLLLPPGGDQALPPSPKYFRNEPVRTSRNRYDQPHTSQTNLSSSYRAMQSPISPSKSLINRDFCEILDRGTIEDVANLLESTGPQPEQLSVSTRNRLYDIISTLLFQGKHIERALVWILALTRGKQKLMQELTVHTQKDLMESLKKVSKEASKRGMLATLLISQINRQVSA